MLAQGDALGFARQTDLPAVLRRPVQTSARRAIQMERRTRV